MRTLYHDESLLVLEFAGVCISVWRHDVTPALFECQRAGLATVLRANPNDAGFMCVIGDGVKPPSDELRKASAQMVRDAGAGLKRIACVIEATGFLAALTRSVLSGMQVLAGRKANVTAFFSTVSEAASWLADELGFDPEPLVEQLAERRAAPNPPSAVTR
ncbi:MAG TPA: hypothetical protein VFX59_02340 [Polyangiales bacterium]|nr:hypothetical protein [Polyangiales bacterium]